MMQLNFLDPACFAELEAQTRQQEQSHQVLKSAPVALKPAALTAEEVGAQIAEKQEALANRLEWIAEIENWLHHEPILESLEREAKELDAQHKSKLSEMYDLEYRTGGELPKSFYMQLEELRNKAGAATLSAQDYRKEHGLSFRPILYRLDEHRERVRELEQEIQALSPPEQAAPPIDCEWSGQRLQCPNCPGVLAPTGPDSWTCDQDKKHQAWPHHDMMAVRSSEGARYWVPGMFGRGVIPDPETVVLEEPAAAESYLNEPVCVFCSGDLVQIAPRGWECSGNSMHAFWIQQGCGVWKEQHGRSILKKAPAWAVEAV